MTAKVVLEVTDGPMRGQKLEFEGHDFLVFGRRSVCSGKLLDASVSRNHFLLEVSHDRVAIQDLGSLHGTYVNGEKLGGRDPKQVVPVPHETTSPAVELSDGDKIQAGETVLQLRIIRAPADKPWPRATSVASDQLGATAPPLISCRECGADVTGEFPTGSPLGYVCQACRRRSGEDANGIRNLLRRARECPPSAYQFEERLGTGAMGEVHAARRIRDGLRVAIKVMRCQDTDPQAREMFFRETAVLQHLDHPHIVRFIDRFQLNRDFHFVMDYCDEGDLQRLTKSYGGQVPLPVLLPLIGHCLQGLQHAHDQGIVHRDLKPTNILLTRNDGVLTAKLGDFGLAKNFERAGLSGLTLTKQFGGTPGFMPREQITEYKYQRPSSDIWSMAATLYYALTGTTPLDFPADRNFLDVILTSTPVPIRERRVRLPDGVADLLDKALSISPEDRFTSAGEMLDALEQAI